MSVYIYLNLISKSFNTLKMSYKYKDKFWLAAWEYMPVFWRGEKRLCTWNNKKLGGKMWMEDMVCLE